MSLVSSVVRLGPGAALMLPLAIVLSVAAGCGESTGPGGAPPHLSLDATSVTLYKGDVKKVVATLTSASGQAVPTPVQWTSADTTLAVVDSGGAIKGVRPGVTTVSATTTSTGSGSTGALTASVSVTVNDDADKPTISAVTVTPSTIDLSQGPATVQVSFTASDAQSGVVHTGVVFESSLNVNGGLPQDFSFQCTPTQPTTAAPTTTGQCSFTLNQYLPSGHWTVDVLAMDAAGNGSIGGTSFTVSGSLPDATPPTLASVSIAPVTPMTFPAGYVKADIAFHISDAESGVADLNIKYANPSGVVANGCGNQGTFSSGSSNDGEFDCPFEIAADQPRGVWSIQSVQVVDARGNTRTYLQADLAAAGFPTTINVP